MRAGQATWPPQPPPLQASRAGAAHAPGLQNRRPASRSAACQVRPWHIRSLPPLTDKTPEATQGAARRKRFINGAWDAGFGLTHCPGCSRLHSGPLSASRALRCPDPQAGSAAAPQVLLPPQSRMRAWLGAPCAPPPHQRVTGAEAAARAFSEKSCYHGRLGIRCS